MRSYSEEWEVPLPAPGMWHCFPLTWGPATYMAWWVWRCMGTCGTWFYTHGARILILPGWFSLLKWQSTGQGTAAWYDKVVCCQQYRFYSVPPALGIALYLRDAMLHAIMTGSQSLILKVADSVGSGVNMGDNSYAFFFGSGGDYNLISQFRAMAKPNGKVVFINSMLYVGAVVYQAYLAVCYISAAVCMVVLVLLFPFAALFEMIERGTISNWVRQVLGILLNPVIDSCLLLIPMFL